MNVDYKLIGSRIKSCRRRKNFTQEQVAEKIGISRQKYARIIDACYKNYCFTCNACAYVIKLFEEMLYQER